LYLNGKKKRKSRSQKEKKKKKKKKKEVGRKKAFLSSSDVIISQSMLSAVAKLFAHILLVGQDPIVENAKKLKKFIWAS
jgi:hypothetical protein